MGLSGMLREADPVVNLGIALLTEEPITVDTLDICRMFTTITLYGFVGVVSADSFENLGTFGAYLTRVRYFSTDAGALFLE